MKVVKSLCLQVIKITRYGEPHSLVTNRGCEWCASLCRGKKGLIQWPGRRVCFLLFRRGWCPTACPSAHCRPLWSAEVWPQACPCSLEDASVSPACPAQGAQLSSLILCPHLILSPRPHLSQLSFSHSPVFLLTPTPCQTGVA